MITDLTKEHPDKILWRFLLPLMISVIFQQFYNIADSMIAGKFVMTLRVTVHGQAFSELKMPYDTVVVADFADLECEASTKSVAVCAMREQ